MLDLETDSGDVELATTTDKRTLQRVPLHCLFLYPYLQQSRRRNEGRGCDKFVSSRNWLWQGSHNYIVKLNIL